MELKIEPSSLLQIGVVGACVLIIALAGWTGWKQGALRQGAILIGVVTGAIAGWLLQPLMRPFMRAALGLPDMLLAPVSMGFVFLIVFLGVGIAGRIWMPATAKFEAPGKRKIVGIIGSLITMAMSTVFCIVTISGLRLVGALAEIQLIQQASAKTANEVQAQPALDSPKHAEASQSKQEEQPFLIAAATFKASMEQGPAGELIKAVDPIPPRLRILVTAIGRITADPITMERFLSRPDVHAIAEHPRMREVLDNPDIVKMLERQDFVHLLRDQRLVDAVNDPDFARVLGELDLEAAIADAETRPLDSLD